MRFVLLNLNNNLKCFVFLEIILKYLGGNNYKMFWEKIILKCFVEK